MTDPKIKAAEEYAKNHRHLNTKQHWLDGWDACLESLSDGGSEFDNDEIDGLCPESYSGSEYIAYKHGARIAFQLSIAREADLKAKIKELESEGSSPYCPTCGICGEDGCCPVEMCKYPNVKSEVVEKLKCDIAALEAKLARYEEKWLGRS